MAISQHLSQFGGLQVRELDGDILPGVALRVPKYDRDYDNPVPDISELIEAMGAGAAGATSRGCRRRPRRHSPAASTWGSTSR